MGEESVNWLCVLRGDVCGGEEVVSMPVVFAGSSFLRFLVFFSAIPKFKFPQKYRYCKNFLRESLLHCQNYIYKTRM